MGITFDSVIKSRTLDLDFRQAGTTSLSMLSTDLFLIIMNISSNLDMGSEDEMRQVLTYYVDKFVQNCRNTGIDAKKMEYVQYALIALIDEKILNLPEEWSDPWRTHMLQLDYFGDMVAGKRFFDHLNLLMKNPGAYWDVLEMYHLCLGLGFKGMFLNKPDELKRFMSKLPSMILSSRPPMARPDVMANKKENRKRRIVPHVPSWAIASAAVVIVVVTWIGFVVATGKLTP